MNNIDHKGFTILELVVVIAIIGILAAVAIPRFLDLSDRAHDAAVEGIQAALASSVAMSKAAWFATGRSGALNNVVYAQGKQGVAAFGIDTNALGWPTGVDKVSGGSDNEQADAADCAALWNAFLDTNAPKVATAGTFPALDYLASAGGNICTWTYKADEDDSHTRTITYDTSTGEVKTNGLFVDEVETGGG